MDTEALWLTLRLALTTTALLLLLALPIAWWIASGKGAARALVQAVVALPLVLPPTVLGFYLLVALGPLTAPGRLIIRLLGHPLAFSFSGLVVGSVLYSLPFAVQPLVAGFRAVDIALLEAAATLGASPMRAFRTITLPLARPSLVAAAVLTFTHTVGEFGVVLMVGGNIPGGDADAVDCTVRPGAGFQLCGGESDRRGAAGVQPGDADCDLLARRGEEAVAWLRRKSRYGCPLMCTCCHLCGQSLPSAYGIVLAHWRSMSILISTNDGKSCLDRRDRARQPS